MFNDTPTRAENHKFLINVHCNMIPLDGSGSAGCRRRVVAELREGEDRLTLRVIPFCPLPSLLEATRRVATQKYNEKNSQNLRA